MRADVLTDKIIGILSQVSGKPSDEIGADSRLIEDLELDSINFIELDHEMRANGLPPVPEHELRRIRLVADVIGLVSRYTPKDSPSP